MQSGEARYVFSIFIAKFVDVGFELGVFAFKDVVPRLYCDLINFSGVGCVGARGLLLGSHFISFGKVHRLWLLIAEGFVDMFVVLVFVKLVGSGGRGLFVLLFKVGF